MQPLTPRYESPEPSKIPTRPRTRKSNREVFVEVMASVQFWGALSVLIALVSLSLPWWGINVGPSPSTSSWGLFFGPPNPQQTNVVFFQDRLDAAFAANYSVMTALVLLTGLITIIGSILKRISILAISLILSIVTVLSFLADVGNAVGNECANIGVFGASCISGLVGQGTSGINIVTWGFQTGFYTFIASIILLIGTLALQKGKSP